MLQKSSNIQLLLAFGALFLLFACGQQNEVQKSKSEVVLTANELHQSVKKLSDVIVHDILSPPVASRAYAYPCIAAYEVLINDSLYAKKHLSLGTQLNELHTITKPPISKKHNFNIAANQAFTQVAKAFIFSKEKINNYQKELEKNWKKTNIPTEVIQNSIKYGNAVANEILAWAAKDNYAETRTFPKYTLSNDADKWQPTPPDYMDAIEPHWNKIRPFVLDSAAQFTPPPPTPFNMNTESVFYKELMEVYGALVSSDAEERSKIASFWDCNPYVSHHKGHLMFATKKITPGGHWVGITSIATKQKNLNIMETAEAYALVSIAIADAFISCWNEKYNSKLIRPETVINQHIDQNWKPLLQTPPFPEYTSGHSVISRAAAINLTHLFGDNFAYNDTVEVEYGLPARQYTSFLQASEEAAISRLYGGIHYRPAIENGVLQGEKIGNFIAKKLKTRKSF